MNEELKNIIEQIEPTTKKLRRLNDRLLVYEITTDCRPDDYIHYFTKIAEQIDTLFNTYSELIEEIYHIKGEK